MVSTTRRPLMPLSARWRAMPPCRCHVNPPYQIAGQQLQLRCSAAGKINLDTALVMRRQAVHGRRKLAIPPSSTTSRKGLPSGFREPAGQQRARRRRVSSTLRPRGEQVMLFGGERRSTPGRGDLQAYAGGVEPSSSSTRTGDSAAIESDPKIRRRRRQGDAGSGWGVPRCGDSRRLRCHSLRARTRRDVSIDHLSATVIRRPLVTARLRILSCPDTISPRRTGTDYKRCAKRLPRQAANARREYRRMPPARRGGSSGMHCHRVGAADGNGRTVARARAAADCEHTTVLFGAAALALLGSHRRRVRVRRHPPEVDELADQLDRARADSQLAPPQRRRRLRPGGTALNAVGVRAVVGACPGVPM